VTARINWENIFVFIVSPFIVVSKLRCAKSFDQRACSDSLFFRSALLHCTGSNISAAGIYFGIILPLLSQREQSAIQPSATQPTADTNTPVVSHGLASVMGGQDEPQEKLR
jgi:hypothetical protein